MTSKEYIKAKLEYLKTYQPSCSFDIDMYEKTLQDLERLEQLEIENRNNEKVIADGVKLMNRNLELQSRLEVLENENKELWENIEKYNHKFASVERKKADLIQVNEKLKNENEELKEKIERMKKIEKYNLRMLCDNPDLD